ncbi:MAG TPA: DUF1549 domain-containing protein, partial [Pirellulales bacterium]|nr:DUF1549 domain-containing protein [Pirellulales bacterium]
RSPRFFACCPVVLAVCALTVPIALAATTSSKPAAAKPAAAQAAESEPIASLELTAADEPGAVAVLSGRDCRQQLIVTGRTAKGRLLDLTDKVAFSSQPSGLVEIDASGLVRPLADGQATIEARDLRGLIARTRVDVRNCGSDLAVNFPNEIVPVFTRFGCNSGGCHGKSGGQNGFRLSLLGFEPTEDFEHLVKEGRGRRLFPGSPDESLLLKKAVNAVPHGGGQRLARDAHEYRLLRRWIAQGMPYGTPQDPTLQRISVYPRERSMQRHARQQVRVLAHYSDGSMQDVTRMAQYEPNNTEMAEVAASGSVTTLDLSGDVAVMARYQGQVAVFHATVPLGAKTDHFPPTRNVIDEAVFAKLKTLGMPASGVCDDGSFIRRVTIDITGRLPTAIETRDFLADKSPSKRDALVDRLLADGGYADYFANKWSVILRNKRRDPGYAHGTFAFHDWIRDSLNRNLPYDQFVRSILAASGEVSDNPAVAWYREVKDVEQEVEDAAQLFLGLRIQCARCHHHPFEKWSQRDYYGFAAFFSRVGRKTTADPSEPRVFHRRGVASSVNPKSGETLRPTGLGAAPSDITPERDPRQALVDWMAEPGNPFFARALVNRYWKHFFSRGIVEPEDDMRVTNPASNPELLEGLSRHFAASGYDLKELVRTICRSTTYQLSSDPNAYNASDKQNFSRFYPRRLAAEVLLDSLDAVSGSPTSFGGLPAGTHAIQLPDSGVNSYFLTVFGRPEASSACECERSQDANLAQSLHLLNSAEVQGKLTSGTSTAARLAGDKRPLEEKIRELYLSVYSRPPAADELALARAHIERAKVPQQAYEDVVWALVNTKEFLFTH